MNNGLRQISEPSFGSVLGGIANDAKDLLMRQVALTKLEVRCELSKGLTAAIALGIGLGIVAAGGMLLMLMLVQGLAALTWFRSGGVTVSRGARLSSWAEWCSPRAEPMQRNWTWCRGGRWRE
jgi:hypothetical protein